MDQHPSVTAPDRSDPSFDTANQMAAFGANDPDAQGPRDASGEPVNLLQMVAEAESRNQIFMGAIQRTRWQRSIKAYRSEHPSDSRYWSEAYKNRTKLYRPKTRTAVRKNMAAAAAAFFSNSDVVSIRPQFQDDPRKQASAAVIHQLLNYRLNRTTATSGTPWFLMCMAANQDSQIHAICVSKQFWEYRTVKRQTQQPALDEMTGAPILDETGQPAMDTVEKEIIIKDRPMTQVMPPENVIVDPSAPWWDPAQGSPYFIAMHPMTIDECRTMLKNPGKSNVEWIDVPDDVLLQAGQDYTTKGVRIARGAGTDRYDNRNSTSGSGIVWMFENFWRVGGEDYHFWSVGRRAYASKIRLTEQSYPEQMGERPYVYGYGQIEAHQTFPQSAVEAWMQMQNEINEQVNLSIDLLKQSLSPIAKVRTGTVFDWKMLQKRGGPDATILVNKMEDLEFITTPQVPGTSYVEMAHLNGDFDDLSGVMSGGSVANNRQLNETVGGMQLLSASANSVTEFDLRVFSETWAEPTLRQMVRLIQFYEADETALAIAGEKAKMMERFGVEQITDEDLLHEVSVSVNVGIGASDPMQRLQKLGMALKMIGEAGQFFKGSVKLKPENFIKEVMGDAGYADGMSLFEIEEDKPSAMEMQGQMKMQLEKLKLENALKIAESSDLTAAEIAQTRAMIDLIDTILKAWGSSQQTAVAADASASNFIAKTQAQPPLKLPTNGGQIGDAGPPGGQPPPGAPPPGGGGGDIMGALSAMMGGGAPPPGGGGGGAPPAGPGMPGQ